MKKAKNRWLIALCAVGIHLSIGSVYAWSVFTNPLAETFGWSLSQISLTFSIAILFLRAFSRIFGTLGRKTRPQKSRHARRTFLRSWRDVFRLRRSDRLPSPALFVLWSLRRDRTRRRLYLHPYLRLLNGFLTAAAWPQGLPLWASDLRL